MKKILISAFDIFGNNAANSSQLVLEQLTENQNLKMVLVPTVRQKSFETLKPFLDEAEIVICLGMASNRDKISLERVAINVDDFRIEDNEGNKPSNQAIIDGGPTAYFSTLPLIDIQSRLESLKIPVEISNSAGTFVCNHLMYQVAHYFQNTKPNGFIHLPSTDKMSLEEMTEAITVVINNI
ncbi:MAG: pyroglutamyl-peptidase I [Erysipelothrix sp.]|nr:pyroglutamyl-peptidase I [Erysipelothrix sp.]